MRSVKKHYIIEIYASRMKILFFCNKIKIISFSDDLDVEYKMAASTSSQKNFQNQKKKNGFKVRALDEITDKYLLNIFHKHFSRDPKLLYQELSLSLIHI